MRTRTMSISLGALGVALSACDGILGINLTLVDAAAVDGGAPDTGGRDAGTHDSATDATTHDGSTSDAKRQDAFVVDATADAHDARPCSTDLDTDPSNCGRCGHSCLLGGTCAEGTCQPVPVSMPQTLSGVPNFLVVSGGKVFWTQGGHNSDQGAYYALASGGNAISVTIGPLDDMGWGIQTDGKVVYFASIGEAVYACPFPGCGADAGMRAVAYTSYYNNGPIPDSISGLALAADVLYVTSNYAIGANTGFLTRCVDPADGGGCVSITSSQATTSSPVVVDGGVLLVTEGAMFANGGIDQCPPTGNCGANFILDMNVTSPQYMAADTSRAYWTEWTGTADGGAILGRVMGCVREECSLTAASYATNQSRPEGIASDGVYVYWVNMTAPSVLACPVAGCPDGGPIVLAADAATGGAPFQVALDEAGVYWSNMREAGTIVRVAKP